MARNTISRPRDIWQSGQPNPYLNPQSAATIARRQFHRDNPNLGAVRLDSALGQYVGADGNPYTGPITGNGGAVLGYSNAGQWSATNPNPEPTPPAFQRNVLYPETAGPATAIASTVATGSSLDFSKMLKDLATEHKASTDAAIKSYDTAPLETEVRGLQRSYETGQGDVLTKFGESNARYAQETKDAIARMTAELDKTEANIRTQAGAASSLAGSVARFPGVGGGDTITSNNAGLAPRIARATLMPQLAAEERIGNLRYGQVANIEMPADQRLYQNDQGLLSFTAALNDKFRGDRFQIASFLNDAKTRMASMPMQLQENYANYVLKLIGGEQAIAAGQLSNLTAAQRLIAASEFLQRDIPEPATAAMQSYPVSAPNMGGPSRQPSLDDLMRLLSQQRGGGGGEQPVRSYPNPSQYLNRFAAGIPFDPNYTSGGSGFVNGQYIGADADAKNWAAYGPEL